MAIPADSTSMIHAVVSGSAVPAAAWRMCSWRWRSRPWSPAATSGRGGMRPGHHRPEMTPEEMRANRVALNDHGRDQRRDAVRLATFDR